MRPTLATDVLRVIELETLATLGEHGLRGLSLSVRHGRVVALVGPNGGGKDVFCACLGGTARATKGQILLDGRPLPSVGWRAARAGLMVALANNRVFDELTVRENLACSFAWWRRPDRTNAIEQVLDLFPALRPRLRQRAGTLSGGEQQMVTIARAFLAQPKLIVLEEPWLGLAPRVVDLLLSRLGMITKDGTSVVLTEESIARAWRYADDVYELADGCLQRVDRKEP